VSPGPAIAYLARPLIAILDWPTPRDRAGTEP